jgi:hypothetical protein
VGDLPLIVAAWDGSFDKKSNSWLISPNLTPVLKSRDILRRKFMDPDGNQFLYLTKYATDTIKAYTGYNLVRRPNTDDPNQIIKADRNTGFDIDPNSAQ